MSDKITVERRTITVEDKSGNRYYFEAKVTREYSYISNTDKAKTLTVWIRYDSMPVSAITFHKDEKTGDYHSPPGSSWDFDLEGRVPLRQGIGTGLWREMEGIFRKYGVVSLNGIIAQPPGMSELLGHGPSESSRKKNEIAKLFWASVGCTGAENREIHKTYKPSAI